MPDYKQGLIYKVYSKDLTDKNIYIGSTCNLKKRVIKHKSDCNNINSCKYNKKLYCYIRNNKGLNNFIIKKIIDSPCNNNEELRIIEQQYINFYDSKLNDRRSYISDEDKKRNNKKYQNKYRIEHSEEIKAQQNKKFSCDCGGKYTQKHITDHKRTLKHVNYYYKENYFFIKVYINLIIYIFLHK